MPKPSVAFAELCGGAFLILVHGDAPVLDADWDDWTKFLRRYRCPPTLVVATTGAAPNAKQRSQVASAVDGRPRVTAVISDKFGVRSVITAMSWFNPAIRAFGSRQLDEALMHLGVSSTVDRSEVERTIAALESLVEVGAGP